MGSITNKNLSKLWIRMKSYINSRIEDIDASVDLAVGNAVTEMEAAIANAGHIEMELLWENAAPTSQFAPQTIEVDLSNYSMIIMTFKSYVSYDYKGLTAIFKKGDAAVVCVNSSGSGINGGALWASNRIITASDDNGITVGQGTYVPYSGTPAVRNDSLLPYQIYGIKGVK